MKTLLLTLLAATAFAAPSWAQAPADKPAAPPAPAKLTGRDIRVHPFAQEHKDVKFKPNTRELPDELMVTRTDRIRIYGKRRSDGSPSVRGVPTGHVGQLALLPPGDHKGTLFVKKAFGRTLFFAVLELPEDSLGSKEIELKEGKNYTWSVKSENGRTTLRVFGQDGAEISSNAAQSGKVLGAGFAATVRNKGNEIDMTINFDQ